MDGFPNCMPPCDPKGVAVVFCAQGELPCACCDAENITSERGWDERTHISPRRPNPRGT